MRHALSRKDHSGSYGMIENNGLRGDVNGNAFVILS